MAPHDASGHTWHHSDDDLVAYIALVIKCIPLSKTEIIGGVSLNRTGPHKNKTPVGALIVAIIAAGGWYRTQGRTAEVPASA